MKALDQFYEQLPDPEKGCMLALRDIILQMDSNITAEWKYRLPFFYYKGKMFCYLWQHKKYKQPYIGIVKGGKIDHPALLTEKRARMKILLVDAEKDIPVKLIKMILQKAMRLY